MLALLISFLTLVSTEACAITSLKSIFIYSIVILRLSVFKQCFLQKQSAVLCLIPSLNSDILLYLIRISIVEI